MNENQLDNLDRVGQVNWLESVADDLTSCNWEGTAEEVVDFWEEQTMLNSPESMPSWYAGHDRDVLVRFTKTRKEQT